jgi:anti-sigma factor RsiW
MNCHRAEPLIFAERDRALAADERAILDAHLAACPACRQMRQRLADAADAWRQETAAAPVPDDALVWQAIRRRIRSPTTVDRTARRAWRPATTWIGLPLAAAAALAVVVVTSDRFRASSPPHLASPVAQAEYVEAGDAAASTLVYLDQESGWLIVWAAPPGANGSG